MATRAATTRWQGGLQDGSGQVTLDSSGLGTYDVSFPNRAADQAEGRTSPEELIAAAHSSCYCMQLSGLLGKAGTPLQSVVAKAEVSFGTQGGGAAITGIVLRVTATVPGISADDFQAIAEKAKETCPVSAALTGTDISLEASLSS